MPAVRDSQATVPAPSAAESGKGDKGGIVKETGSPEGRAQLSGVAGVPRGPGRLPGEMCPLRLQGRPERPQERGRDA